MNLPSYLMAHQRTDVALGFQKKRHLYANDTGTGKTVIGIELHRAIKANADAGIKTLVVCPLSIIEPAWMEDLAKFAPELKAINLWKTLKKGTKKDKKREALVTGIKDSDVCIINFESFIRLFDPRRGWGLTAEEAPFNSLMVDESSKAKNPKSKITKALIKYSDNLEYCYLFSGTPAPNSQLEYFPQVRMVNQYVFGKSYYQFRNRYFYPAGFGGYTWLPRKDLVQTMNEKLALVSSAVLKKDVLDLPDRTFNTRNIQLSPSEQRHYNEMMKHLYLQIDGNEITAANAAVKCSKLRQICSGFIIDENKRVEDLGQSRLNELLSLLGEIGDKPVVIWTQFRHEAMQIVKALRGIEKVIIGGETTESEPLHTVGRVDGTATQADKEEYIRQFKNGSIQYLVAHPRSLAHGVTLINCTDMIYYSMSYSLEEYLQSRDRIYRYGQKNICTYHFLTASGTVDDAVLKAVKRKKSVASEVIDYIKNNAGGRHVRR